MQTPCFNTLELGKHLDEQDALFAQKEYIDNYVLEHLDAKMKEIAQDFPVEVVMEALEEGNDAVDMAFYQAHNAVLYKRLEQKEAIYALGKAVYDAAAAFLKAQAEEELEEEAEYEMEKQSNLAEFGD